MEARIERPDHVSAIINFLIPKVCVAREKGLSLQVQICNIDQGGEWTFLLAIAEAVTFRLPIPLPPGNTFVVTSRILARWPPDEQPQHTTNIKVGYKTIHSVFLSFRTELTMGEILQLQDKAIAFMSRRYPKHVNEFFKPCLYFYRGKPKKYFDEIFDLQAGVMTVYRKNNNGDPASPINGEIDGLFFDVNADFATGLPEVPSLYGPIRLHIMAWFMFQDAPRMYFCDFYCHNRTHHATLVLTKRGSDADMFCSSRLLRLSNHKNPFLHVDCATRTVFVSTRVRVQVLYTENLDLHHIIQTGQGFIRRVESKPVPASMADGIPKNPACTICNLNPITPGGGASKRNLGELLGDSSQSGEESPCKKARR